MFSWRWGLVFLLGGGCQSEASGDSVCSAYIRCLEASDAAVEQVEAASANYGSSGSCFDERSEEGCEQICRSRTEEIAQMLASVGTPVDACELSPSEPDEVPVPDAEGFIDCARVDAENTIAPEPVGPSGFPEMACSPRRSGSGDFFCCSDDPASVGGGTPNYEPGLPVEAGAPYFAGANNDEGSWGLCVRTGDFSSGMGLEMPAGCPVACNPTWGIEEANQVCGVGMSCCQTQELQPEDCIEDTDGVWRPVVGADLLAGRTDWAPQRHATHQDPGADACAELAGSREGEAFESCVRELGVADQRGFCLAAPADGCPLAAPGYFDACEQINMGLIPPPGD